MLLLPVILYSQSPEPSDNPNQTNSNSISGISTQQDYGRIVSGVPKASLTVCAPAGSRFATLFTNKWGGLGETYPINPGQRLTLPAIERSYWIIEGTPYTTDPVRFNLVEQMRFELQYRNTLPTALQPIYYPNQPNVQLQLPYLAFIQHSSIGLLRLTGAPNNWTVNIDVRTRLCHSATEATINADCTGITGQEGCANIVGRLQVARSSSNPGTNCSDVCRWFDPPSTYYGQNYYRSWQGGTLQLTFNWSGDNEGTSTVQTPISSGAVEGVQVSLSPAPYGFFGLSAASEAFKGLIMMRKRAFLDGSKSLDPLGFPELGENELVFVETPTGVTLQTAVSAWVLCSPPESFLLRIPNPDGSETVFIDVVEWYAERLFWRSRIPFSFFNRGYGYDHLGGRSGNIPIWERARYSAFLLPDYNPNLSTNLLGSQVMEMVFRERSGSPGVVVGRARYEVFFPATGSRHPSGAVSEPAGLTIPNWFYYYWRAMGSPAVVYTTQDPDGTDPGGFYIHGRQWVYLRNKTMNYVSTTLPLFAIRQGQCPQGTPSQVVTHVDDLDIYGIHCFARTVYHEFGHKWSYETNWQIAPGVWMPIAGPAGRSGDGDEGRGDKLLDAWEQAHGLCPYRRHTTDAYPQYQRRDLPSDPEIVADVIAYGALLNVENTPNASLWRRDWSDKGLQFGNPLERFPAFPWRYSSTNRNFSSHHDLLIGWSP